MSDSRKQVVEQIIGRSLLTAETFGAQLRERLVRQVANDRNVLSQGQILAVAAEILQQNEPIFAQIATDSELAAWIAGTQEVLKQLPSVVAELLEGPQGPPDLPVTRLLAGGSDEPVIRFPLIERAAKSLFSRNIVMRDEFDALGRAARERAFTVAFQDSQDAIERIRDSLVESVIEGTSLTDFRDRVRETLTASRIGPAHLENVFRTNVQAAFHQAHDELASNPIVAEVFPYQEYLPIRDGRVRDDHLALASLGLSGTGVYRRDDPFWDLFTPPWDFQCVIPDTLMSGRFLSGIKSRYDGEIVEIVTSRGDRATLTINHPVFTSRGLRPAGAIKKGEYLFGDLGIPNGLGASFPHCNENDTPRQAKDIFSSLEQISGAVRIPVRADDLHGDATAGQGYVDVVGANGILLAHKIRRASWWVAINYQIASHALRKFRFMRPNLAVVDIPRSRQAAQRLKMSPLAFSGFPSGSTLPLDLFRSKNLNRDGQDDSRRRFAVCRVVDTFRHDYRGDVYDFETVDGWQIAGGIKISNCRCAVNLLTVEAAARKGVEEARRWQRTGQAPLDPEFRIDAIPFRPPDGFVGGRRRLSAV